MAMRIRLHMVKIQVFICLQYAFLLLDVKSYGLGL